MATLIDCTFNLSLDLKESSKVLMQEKMVERSMGIKI